MFHFRCAWFPVILTTDCVCVLIIVSRSNEDFIFIFILSYLMVTFLQLPMNMLILNMNISIKTRHLVNVVSKRLNTLWSYVYLRSDSHTQPCALKIISCVFRAPNYLVRETVVLAMLDSRVDYTINK